jgi:hypothetical protein
MKKARHAAGLFVFSLNPHGEERRSRVSTTQVGFTRLVALNVADLG